jgi:hypothetical protein
MTTRANPQANRFYYCRFAKAVAERQRVAETYEGLDVAPPVN